MIIVALVALGVGFGIAKFLEKGKASKTITNAKKEASNIIKSAKKKERVLRRTKSCRPRKSFWN